MKILILIITLYAPSMMTSRDYKTTTHIVYSKEEAAIMIWESNKHSDQWHSYSDKLYEIDLEKMTVKEIKIPEINFKE